MKTVFAATLSLALVIPTALQASEPVPLDNENSRINYSLGFQIGSDFKNQGVEMNAAAVLKGIEDALQGSQPQLSQPEMYGLLAELKRKVVEQQSKTDRKVEVENIRADEAYAAEYRRKDGVKVTDSGLMYRIIAPGKGKKPTRTDTITVNYRGTLTNGNEFDSTYKRGEPGKFQLSSIIPGWIEGLPLIAEGGKIEMVIPSHLAYGRRGPLAHRTLVFEIELLSVDNTKVSEAGTTR